MMIVHPTFLINEARCRENIRAMALKARKNGLCFRPHFKTHQSIEVASWFREESSAITVSSLRMAEFFINAGWKDLTLAFPVNIRALDTIQRLTRAAEIRLLVESNEVIDALDNGLAKETKVFVKIDLGYGRTGIPANNVEAIDRIIQRLGHCKTLNFAGFLSHAGHSYDARSREQVAAIHKASIATLTKLKDRYSQDYPELILSIGDTPTCSIMDDFPGIDEIRPGNFVFFDLMQVLIGSCQPEQIAVAMACPVVAIHPSRNEVIIHGGGVHFSKEVLDDPIHGRHYGQVAEATTQDAAWGAPIAGAYLKKLSQEHGTIVANPAFIDSLKIGDLVKILPIHSCMTANLMRDATLIVPA
ncbi:MAG: alanine racemase [Planctomycetota bacterium]|nr:alanine racemase [Planctomycetota bacterium]